MKEIENRGFADDFSICLSIIGAGVPVVGTFLTICCPSVFSPHVRIAWLLLLVWVIMVGAGSSILKLAFTSAFPTVQWLRRPHGACNCDPFNSDGYQGDNPGFPSGHCSIAALYASVIVFFPIYEALLTSKWDFKRIVLSIVISFLIVCLTCRSRVEKRCHNWLQAIGGLIWGGFMGILFCLMISRFHKNEIKIENNSFLN